MSLLHRQLKITQEPSSFLWIPLPCNSSALGPLLFFSFFLFSIHLGYAMLPAVGFNPPFTKLFTLIVNLPITQFLKAYCFVNWNFFNFIPDLGWPSHYHLSRTVLFCNYCPCVVINRTPPILSKIFLFWKKNYIIMLPRANRWKVNLERQSETFIETVNSRYELTGKFSKSNADRSLTP
jgi:hypothetical protein